MTTQSMVRPLLVRAICGEMTERPPVWLMRQAGRYLEEYRAVKEKSSFLEMCRTPELAVEVSMQPVRFFDVDAAIVFADILLPAECLGIEVVFAPGPKILNPLRTVKDLKSLRRTPDVSPLAYVGETIRGIKSQLATGSAAAPKAVIGFAGAPWTMACYLLEQAPYKHFERTSIFAKEHPAEFAEFLNLLGRLTEEYLLSQVEAGADVVQLFESWGGILSLEDYRRYALPVTKQIVASLEARGIPVILYANGSAHLLPAMREAGASCLSIDARTSLVSAFSGVDKSTSIQGNFEPTDLFLSATEVSRKTREMISQVPKRGGYVANLGHGILQTTPRESVKAFVEAVQKGWEGNF